MNKKTAIVMIISFAAAMLLSSCFYRTRSSRRCYKNARGRTVCTTHHHTHRRR
ncbi:hypothetical protein KKF34_18760 [Myxococcota bacterium]|nr:hypothetical protein [Myxococcota bacterium]MBU1380794.1 hypothetical protein [Myxococcota bacterium]MBU1498928.1 hypothetical protein [Myxococcota bacterium]